MEKGSGVFSPKPGSRDRLVKEVQIFDFRLISGFMLETLLAAYRTMRAKPSISIFDEKDAPDRRALDDVVFDILRLTAGEREAVYEQW